MTDLYGNIPISGEDKKKDSAPPAKRIKDTPPPPTPEKQKHHPRGKEKYLIFPAAVIILLMSYYGLTTLFIPLYLEKKFPSLFQEKTGLSLDLGSVNFNPLKSALIIDNISISTLSLASAKADLLNIDTLYLDLDITSLLKRGIASESVLIKGALLSITKYDDSTYNISRFLPQGISDSSAFVNLSKIPFLYSLNNIVVSESRVDFEDLSSKTKHRIENLHLSLPTIGNFSYEVDDYIQPGFSAIINGSPVRLTSDPIYSAPGGSDDSSKLSLSLQSVNLPLYASYIPAELPVTVKQGNADLDIEIAFKAQQNEDFRLNLDFQAQIENGLFESKDEAISLETPALRLEGSIMPLAGEITMRNVLFRDPVVTVKNTISASTISSLSLENAKSENSDNDFLRSAALDISLLIADNGKYIFKSKNGDRVFHPVQLSIKDFANTKSLIANPEDREKRSFRLSGESKNNNTIFSWQGTFNKTTPTGDLEIINLPAEDLLTLLTQNPDIKIKGSAELRGKFTVTRSQKSPFAIVIDQGEVALSSLVLEENDNAVLESSKIRLSPFRLDENSAHLGNIFVEGAILHIDESNPPSFMDLLSNKSNTLQGLDLKGTINVMQKEGKSPLKMKNVHLQVTNLEKSGGENDNLAFSATFEKNGSLSAKGRFSVSPISGVVEFAAQSIPATLLFAGDLNSNYSFASTTMANITGKYDFSSESFNGRAELSAGEITTSQGEVTYGFDKVALGKLSINKKAGKYSGENILCKDFIITNKNYTIQAEGLSISSYVMEDKTTNIDSVEFVKAKVLSQEDFSKLFPALHKQTGNDLNIFEMHMSGSLSTAGQDQKKTPFIEEFSLSIKTPEKKTPERKDIDFKAQFVDQGSLAFNGSMQIEPLQLQIDMTLDNVSSKLLGYFPSDLAQSQLNAAMSGEASYTYPEKIIAGNILLNKGSILDKKDMPLLTWQKADLQNFNIGISPLTVAADKLFLDTPQTTFNGARANIFSQIHENVKTYLHELKEENKSTADSKFMIRRLDLNDGLIGYTLPNISSPLELKLTSVDGYINNFHIHETDDNIDYSFQGTIADGNFSYTGSFNHSPGSLENETSLKLTSFPLALLEKQLSSLFDISFTDSILDLSSDKKASSNEYFTDITLTSLDIEDPSSATALTFALLSESNDKLSMSIPLKDTSQSLFTQVSNYFQRLIVKCSVSPYLLLDWPYDSLGDRNSVSFAPGKTELTLESRDTLLDYSSLLEKHPRLQLKLETIVQRSADTRALREILTAVERKRVQQENEKLLQEWQQQQISTKVSQTPSNDITVQDISEENLAEFTPKSSKEIIITETMLKQLGIERAEQIRKYILEQSSISENNIAEDAGISITDTVDMPEVIIRLSHIDQN